MYTAIKSSKVENLLNEKKQGLTCNSKRKYSKPSLIRVGVYRNILLATGSIVADPSYSLGA